MKQKCDMCDNKVVGLLKVSGPKDFPKHWCFACIYEKGLVDYNERNLKWWVAYSPSYCKARIR